MRNLFSVALLSLFTVPSAWAYDCTLANGADLPALQWAIQNCATINTAADAHVTLASASPIVLEIPATTQLNLQGGSNWTIGAGVTVHVNGPFSISLQRRRFFDGDGSIVGIDSYGQDGCPVTQRTVYPEWFGAVTNDSTDDSEAILRALVLGNHLELASGTYDLRNRIPLLRHQTIVGAGKSISRLNQMATANLINFREEGQPGYEDWNNVKLQDFIVSLNSDCAKIQGLSILGGDLPNNANNLSNIYATQDGLEPIVTGIQISSHYGWTPGTPPVKNVAVTNVEVYRPLSNCINIQSDRGVNGVTIDGLTCTARTERANTSGLTVEVYDPTVTNFYENVTVKNSTFTGGKWGFYVAGVENFIADNVTIDMQPGAFQAVLWYTGDCGHKTTGLIQNSHISFNQPAAGATSLIDVNARGYVKDYLGQLPYLVEKNSSLKIQNSVLSAAEAGAGTLIPLIKDSIGIAGVLEVSLTQFHGGSYAILAGNLADNEAFGATVYIKGPTNNDPTLIRDVTNAEISSYQLKHSDYAVSQSHFYRQAYSAIRMQAGAMQVTDSTFHNIGTSIYAAEAIIDLRGLSPFSTRYNFFSDNQYSAVNNTVFVRAPNSDSQSPTFIRNTAYSEDNTSRNPSTITMDHQY